MDLRPLFLICFIVIFASFLFVFFYITIEDEKEFKTLIKIATIFIFIGCICLIKIMYF